MRYFLSRFAKFVVKDWGVEFGIGLLKRVARAMDNRPLIPAMNFNGAALPSGNIRFHLPGG